MSAFAAPFGLKPLYHPSGNVRPKALDIASGYNTSLFQYGVVALGAPALGLIAGPIAGPIIGCFLGCEYTPSDGRRRYAPNWPANQVATQIVAYYTDDELITYEIQSNTTVTEGMIGNQANVTAEVGNATTGFSTQALDVVGSISTSGNALLRIVGCTQGPLNALGDAFTIVQVQIANHQFRATRVAI